MKYILKSLLIAILALATTACSKDNPFGWGEDSEGKGQVSFKKMMVEVTNEEKLVRAGVNLDNFNVIVVDQYGAEVNTYKYAEMPDVITLPVGKYTVKVNSGNNPDADWDVPYFEGVSDEFTIVADDITEVQTVVCKLANVRVSIRYSAELKAKMGSDCKVNVKVGDEQTGLDFYPDETRSGYFKYVEGNKTLVATFTGTVDGSTEINNFQSKTDVTPGNHYIITYTLKDISGDIPDVTGGANPAVGVDATITEVDLTVDVPVDDDLLTDDQRPTEGDPDPTPGPDDPVTPPAGKAPQVWVEEPLNIDINNYVTADSHCVIRASSEAAGGFTQFEVTIVSDVLTPEELAGVGLTDKLNLVNPGQYEESLNNLGFPTGSQVKGQTSFSADISGFLGLLQMASGGTTATHKFVVKVSDANGTTTKTLTLTL